MTIVYNDWPLKFQTHLFSVSIYFLIDYLSNDNEIAGRNGVSGVYGYWILSSCASYSNYAWAVDHYGSADDNFVNYVGHGARPVINLSI